VENYFYVSLEDHCKLKLCLLWKRIYFLSSVVKHRQSMHSALSLPLLMCWVVSQQLKQGHQALYALSQQTLVRFLKQHRVHKTVDLGCHLIIVYSNFCNQILVSQNPLVYFEQIMYQDGCHSKSTLRLQIIFLANKENKLLKEMVYVNKLLTKWNSQCSIFLIR